METSTSYGFQRVRKTPEDEYPLAEVSLGVLLHIKTHVAMPEKALARLALRELRRMAGEIEVRHLKPTRPKESREEIVKVELVEKPIATTPADFSGLDKRIVKTAYRILDLVAVEEAAGGEALASELSQHVSPATLARFLDANTDAGQAASAWFHVEKRGRTKALRLTEEGRRVAQNRLLQAKA